MTCRSNAACNSPAATAFTGMRARTSGISYGASAIVVAAMALGPAASGQTPAPVPAQPMPQAVQEPGRLDLRRLIGRDVRGPRHDIVGRIDAVMVDAGGTVRAVIIGLAGAPGMGERCVAISWDQLRLRRDADDGVSLAVVLTDEQLRALPPCGYDRNAGKSG